LNKYKCTYIIIVIINIRRRLRMREGMLREEVSYRNVKCTRCSSSIMLLCTRTHMRALRRINIVVAWEGDRRSVRCGVRWEETWSGGLKNKKIILKNKPHRLRCTVGVNKKRTYLSDIRIRIVWIVIAKTSDFVRLLTIMFKCIQWCVMFSQFYR